MKLPNLIQEIVIFNFINGSRVVNKNGVYINWGMLWELINPLIIVSGWTMLFYLGIRGGRHDLAYFVFILSLFFGFTQIITNLIEINLQRRFLEIKSFNILVLLISNLTYSSILLFVRMLIVFYVMTFFEFNINYYSILYGILLIIIFSLCYGTIALYYLVDKVFLKNLHRIFLTALFIFSSIIIPVSILPEEIRSIVLYNPLVHLFEWIKEPITGITYSYIDLNYFLNFLASMILITPIYIWLMDKNRTRFFN